MATKHVCACGCNTPLRRGVKPGGYLQAHIPKALRQQWAKHGNRRRRELGKLRRFRADVDRLFAEGRATKGEIVAAMAIVYERGYLAGWSVGRKEVRKPFTVDQVLERLSSGPKRRTELGGNIQAVSCALSKLRAQGIVEPIDRGVWALARQVAKTPAA